MIAFIQTAKLVAAENKLGKAAVLTDEQCGERPNARLIEAFEAVRWVDVDFGGKPPLIL